MIGTHFIIDHGLDNQGTDETFGNLEKISQSAIDIKITRLAKLLLWFLRGSSVECKDDKQGKETFQSPPPMSMTVNQTKNQKPLKLRNVPVLSSPLQIDAGKINQRPKQLQTPPLNQLAANVVKTNERLKQELDLLKKKRKKGSSMSRKKRSTMQRGPSDQKNLNQCEMELDEDTAHVLNKISQKMSTKEVETLSKLLTTFLLSANLLEPPLSSTKIVPNSKPVIEESQTDHPNSIINRNGITPNIISQRLHRIQAQSNILHRRKRSIVDFERGYHRGYYAHKVESFPRSMRAKQQNMTISKPENENEKQDYSYGNPQDVIEVFPNGVRTEDKKHTYLNSSAKTHSKKVAKLPSQEVVDNKSLQKEINSFPAMEKINEWRYGKSRDGKDQKNPPQDDQGDEGNDYSKHSKPCSKSDIECEASISKGQGTLRVEMLEPNDWSKNEVPLTTKMKSNSDKTFFKSSLEDDEYTFLSKELNSNEEDYHSVHDYLEKEMADLIERKINYDRNKKMGRKKRSIVEFDYLESIPSDYKDKEIVRNDKINRFPDTERTRGERKRSGNSVFGFSVRGKRLPIIDFENMAPIKSKHKHHGKHRKMKMININQFPHTERLMAPGKMELDTEKRDRRDRKKHRRGSKKHHMKHRKNPRRKEDTNQMIEHDVI